MGPLGANADPSQPLVEGEGPDPFGTARRVIDATLHAVATLVREARRDGVANFETVLPAAEALALHVMHDADSIHWALRMEDHGGYLLRRAAGTAVAATTLGRHLGFDAPTLHALALGGLLLDLGKTAVPVPILAKPQALDAAEQTYVRRHVERGLALLAHHRGLDPRVLEMMAGHHERLDGSGYPHQLRGTRIALFARIAAIADAFDAMTLNRRYAAAMSAPSALRQLEAQQGEKLDAALISELAHALGAYPIGTLVELVDGSLGLVCASPHGHTLQPHVIVTHDASRQALASPHITETSSGADIIRSLPPHVAQIDTNRLDPVLRGFRPAA